MKLLSCLILLSLPNFSIANSIYLGLVSAHFNWEYGCFHERCQQFKTPNHNHNLIMIEYKGYEIGSFKNSYSDQTFLIARQIELGVFSDLRAIAHIGVDYGYHVCSGEARWNTKNLFCPRLMFEIEYTKYRFQPVIIFFGEGMAISTRYTF